jgi:hypothetical protein
MPDSEITRLTAERGRRPTDLQIRPNQLDQTNLRGNFGFALARNAQLDVSTSYSDRTLYTPFDGGFFAGLTFQMMTAPGFRTATNGTQREFVGDIMSIEQKLAQQRFVGSASLAYTPLPWLQARAVVGLDPGQQLQPAHAALRRGAARRPRLGPAGAGGGIDNDRSDNRRYSVDLGATATWNATQAIVSKTTVGAQWFRDGLYQAQGQGYGFAPGVITPNSASQRQSWEFTTENATYGAFLEQQVGWRDRLIGAVGVRTDQNSAFGRNVGNTVYPRASLSYVISEEPWFRRPTCSIACDCAARGGRAGVQPGTIAALQFLGAVTVPLGGAEAPALRIASIGNEALRPEVTTELEMGFDAGLLNDRVNVEATLFNKISRDALFQRPLHRPTGPAPTSGRTSPRCRTAASSCRWTSGSSGRSRSRGTCAPTARASSTGSSTPAGRRSPRPWARATSSAIRCSASGSARSSRTRTATATASSWRARSPSAPPTPSAARRSRCSRAG